MRNARGNENYTRLLLPVDPVSFLLLPAAQLQALQDRVASPRKRKPTSTEVIHDNRPCLSNNDDLILTQKSLVDTADILIHNKVSSNMGSPSSAASTLRVRLSHKTSRWAMVMVLRMEDLVRVGTSINSASSRWRWRMDITAIHRSTASILTTAHLHQATRLAPADPLILFTDILSNTHTCSHSKGHIPTLKEVLRDHRLTDERNGVGVIGADINGHHVVSVNGAGYGQPHPMTQQAHHPHSHPLVVQQQASYQRQAASASVGPLAFVGVRENYDNSNDLVMRPVVKSRSCVNLGTYVYPDLPFPYNFELGGGLGEVAKWREANAKEKEQCEKEEQEREERRKELERKEKEEKERFEKEREGGAAGEGAKS
ncbi:YTP1 [Coprinopsis cinerea AmutBmut pab1-1]|nr:YTP1 [Coprinopsis cinerea AmutBmut pab1-1]